MASVPVEPALTGAAAMAECDPARSLGDAGWPLAIAAALALSALAIPAALPIALRAGWVAVVMATLFVRWRLDRKRMGQEPSGSDPSPWLRVFTLGLAVSGAQWGLFAAACILFGQPVEQFLATLIAAGLCAGSATVYYAHRPAYLSFLAASLLPIFIAFSWHARPIYLLGAGATALYGAGLTAAAERTRRVIGGLVDANQHMRTLAAGLHAARLEAELANRAKSDFLANMSHELRTPLNAVIGFSEIISQELFGPIANPKYLSYGQDILNSGQHLLNLINDILDLAKVEAGQLELEEGQADIEALCATCRQLMAERAARAGVDITVAVTPGIIVLADPLRLKQIVLNLLSNGVKFSPPGGRVTISARKLEDGDIVIRVEDGGIGMHPEEVALALQPFRQIDGGRARHKEGAGLGLPLTRRFVELHGGRLQIVSQPGIGTEVAATLPAWRLISSGPAEGALSCMDGPRVARRM